MHLEITTPPTGEPIALTDVKARLRLTSTTDDSTITQQMSVARRFAERVTRRSLAYKTYTLFLDRFPIPNRPIRLPAPPMIEVNSITYFDQNWDSQTWDESEYFVAPMQTPGLIIPAQGFIYPVTPHGVPGCVQISFSSGYYTPGAPSSLPVIPDDLAEGIRQLTVHIYEHPEAVTAEGLKECPLALMSFLRANRFYEFE